MSSKLFNVIAVDGLAATGKGTLARRVAEHLGYAYLDTGLLYRAVGLSVIVSGGDPSDPAASIPAAQALDPVTLDALLSDPRLRSDVGGQAASKVGAIQGVRDALFMFQRSFALNPPDGKAGAVLDGRDIGTVIAPDAMVKIYVEASPEIRAHRRFLELQSRGENVTEAAVLEDLRVRDARDVSRSVVPAKPAEDAVSLDTSHLSIDEAVAAAIKIVEGRRSE
jgi:cytidylate kinase